MDLCAEHLLEWRWVRCAAMTTRVVAPNLPSRLDPTPGEQRGE